MATTLLTIVLASASLGGAGIDGAQGSYMRCLDTELNAALSRRVEGTDFATGIARVCGDETATYRRMAVAAMVGQGVANASPDAANRRFDAFDRDTRAEMIAAFEQRMKLRRGPARVSGLAADRTRQHD